MRQVASVNHVPQIATPAPLLKGAPPAPHPLFSTLMGYAHQDLQRHAQLDCLNSTDSVSVFVLQNIGPTGPLKNVKNALKTALNAPLLLPARHAYQPMF